MTGGRRARALCGLVLAPALWASGAAGDDYEWPVAQVVDGGTLIVDAGADLPPELAMLRVRVVGPSGWEWRRDDGDIVSELLAGASKVVIRNPRYGDENCDCQVVAEVFVDGAPLWGLVLLELSPVISTPDNRPRQPR